LLRLVCERLGARRQQRLRLGGPRAGPRPVPRGHPRPVCGGGGGAPASPGPPARTASPGRPRPEGRAEAVRAARRPTRRGGGTRGARRDSCGRRRVRRPSRCRRSRAPWPQAVAQRCAGRPIWLGRGSNCRGWAGSKSTLMVPEASRLSESREAHEVSGVLHVFIYTSRLLL
jgi:hypothetical protein